MEKAITSQIDNIVGEEEAATQRRTKASPWYILVDIGKMAHL